VIRQQPHRRWRSCGSPGSPHWRPGSQQQPNQQPNQQPHPNNLTPVDVLGLLA